MCDLNYVFRSPHDDACCGSLRDGWRLDYDTTLLSEQLLMARGREQYCFLLNLAFVVGYSGPLYDILTSFVCVYC